MRAWLEVTVAAPPGLPAELAAAALFEAGATGLEERPERADGRVEVVAYLPRARLPLDAGPLAAIGAAVVGTRALPDRDWENEWRRGLAPLELGRRILVVPSDGACDASSPARIVIRLDPGSAFGTGLHPTTALVADALDDELSRRPGASVLDVGTGSGLLAIAASLLGARPVLAIDNDPEAVAEARRNAAANACSEGFEASEIPLDAIEARYELVLANLDAPTLARVHAALIARVAPGGTLVVSGLRAGEGWPAPGTPVTTTMRDGWQCERYRFSSEIDSPRRDPKPEA